MVSSTRRSYEQYCGLARALDLVGERWTLLVVRNLLLGPLRYGELLRGLPGITTNLLAKRLREMEEHGLIERVRAAAGEGGLAYRLTPLGAGLEPAVHALGSWGWNWMRGPAEGEHRSVEWLLVALRRRYRGGEALLAEIVADQVPYVFRLAPQSVEISRGTAPAAELRLRGPASAFVAMFLGSEDPGRLPAEITVEAGTAEGAETLMRAFTRGDALIAS